MTTRLLSCPSCQHHCERTAIGMAEPSHDCFFCEAEMKVVPSFPAGVKYIGPGFHCIDYPKSQDQKIKDYGLERHDSTIDNSDYNQEGYDGS